MQLWRFTLAGLLWSTVLASSGDRLQEFKECIHECVQYECPSSLPFHLRLLQWTCDSNCDYLCQQILTDEHIHSHSRVHQYHGKWPFFRLLGIQEPASVVFSIWNLIPHAIGYRMIKRTTRNSAHFQMKKYYLGFAIAGANAWFWSSVFHTRDFVFTERMDYLSAVGSITYGMFLALVRIFRLDLAKNEAYRRLVMLLCLGFYACHVGYLTLIHFNYSYNMAAMVVVGVIQNLLWIFFSIRTYLQTHERMYLLPAGVVLLVMLGMGFELFDFSPFFRVFDAHSLWHAATVFPTYQWYKFIAFDMKQAGRKPTK